MKTLFIGGGQDGNWIDVTEFRPIMVLMKPPAFKVSDWCKGISPSTPGFEKEEYRLVSFMEGKEEHRLYVARSMPSGMIFASLMKGYKA